MKDKKTFGSFIKEKRIKKNYSQKDLAELLYVSESAVSKWERGVSYPDISLITNICRVLEISEKELIQSSDDDEYRKIKSNSDKFNKIKKTLFWIINICYIVALLTCFIVNLAVNHTLSWFFIVLTSIFTAFTFCPTLTWISKKYKRLIFIGSTFISLFFLFLTCSVYSNNYWFMIPTIGVLLSYFIIFYPILFTNQKHYLDIEKYKKLSKYFLLSYTIIILLLIVLLLVFINLYSPFNIGLGIIITSGVMLVPIIYGIIYLIDASKKIVKLISLLFSSIIVVFILLNLGSAVYLKSTEEIKFNVINETYNKVNINVQTDDINIYLSSNESQAVYVENKNISIETKVVNETLFINRIDNRKFYERMFSLSTFKIDLYLSVELIESLIINCHTGDVLINEGFTINNADITNSTGDIIIKSNVAKNLYINNSTGNVILNNCDSMGNVNIETSTGDIDIRDVNCNELKITNSTGDINLINTIVENDSRIIGSTGDVYLDSFDASNIYIELSTGNVKGTILTSKFFIANSDTGKVNVPETRDGGECRINVDTGNIHITYKYK